MMIPLLPPYATTAAMVGDVEFRHGGGEEEQAQGLGEMFLPSTYSIQEIVLRRIEQDLVFWGC